MLELQTTRLRDVPNSVYFIIDDYLCLCLGAYTIGEGVRVVNHVGAITRSVIVNTNTTACYSDNLKVKLLSTTNLTSEDLHASRDRI